jgi:hypothetical protein
MKLDTPSFTKETLVEAVARGSLPSPDYLSAFSLRNRELAARYPDAEGNQPDYLDQCKAKQLERSTLPKIL